MSTVATTAEARGMRWERRPRDSNGISGPLGLSPRPAERYTSGSIIASHRTHSHHPPHTLSGHHDMYATPQSGQDGAPYEIT